MRRLLFPGFQNGKVKGLRPGDRPDHCIDLKGLEESRLAGQALRVMASMDLQGGYEILLPELP